MQRENVKETKKKLLKLRQSKVEAVESHEYACITCHGVKCSSAPNPKIFFSHLFEMHCAFFAPF